MDNVSINKVNSLPAIIQHLTPKQNVEGAIDESTLVGNNQDNDFNSSKLTKMKSFTLNTQAVLDIQVITKLYVHLIQ